MSRFGFLLVLAAAAGFATTSHAYLTPGLTNGTEVALVEIGPGIWDLTIENSQNADTGGSFAILNAGLENWNPNPAVCALGNVLCSLTDGDEVGDPLYANILYIGIVADLVGALNPNVGAPRRLATLQGAPGADFTIQGLEDITGTPGHGFPGPVVFYRQAIPEPAALAFLGLGFASLAFLRRRAA